MASRAVLSSTGKPVSAKQNFLPLRSRGPIFLCQLLGLLLLLFPPLLTADSLEESARSLARRVASNLRSSSATCVIRNFSSLGSADLANYSTAFQDELQKHSLKIVEAEAAVSIVLIVTQGPTEYFGVAQIQRKETTDTVMETIGLVRGPAPAEQTSNYSLRAQLLFSQDTPIVDVVLSDDGTSAEALGSREIFRYALRDERWAPVEMDPLPVHITEARNPRGFLDHQLDSQAVRFPKEICTSSISTGGWSCRSYAGPWVVRTVSVDEMAGKKLQPWFSATQLLPKGRNTIVVTGEDGLARLYEDAADAVAVFANWGSEIASVKSGCGSGWQLLVTNAADWTKPDEVRALEIRGRQALPVSAPLAFPGPVVALHAAGMNPVPGTGANERAVAIIRNLQTGRYEAYLLTITCSN